MHETGHAKDGDTAVLDDNIRLRTSQARLDEDDAFPTTTHRGHQYARAALMFVDMNDFVHFMFSADDDDDDDDERRDFTVVKLRRMSERRRESYGCEHAATRRRRRDELIRDALRDYFSKLAVSVDAYGGEIVSFIGDAVLVAWFAKRVSNEHSGLVSATRVAAFCAESIAARVHGGLMCARWSIAVKIMVSCGDVVVIDTGDERTREALLVGQAVDDLYTLKRYMRPGRVAYSAQCLRLLEDEDAITTADTSALVLSSSHLYCPNGHHIARRSVLEDDVFDRAAAAKNSFASAVVGRTRAACAVTFYRFVPERARGRAEGVEYVDAIQRAVHVIQHGVCKSGGVIVQIVVDEDGPACLCAFGLARDAKDNTRDAPTRAVRCAQCVLASFAREVPMFEIAVGISTGCVNIGPAMARHALRRELTLIGVPVILAARFADAALKNASNGAMMLLDCTTRVEAAASMIDFVAMTTQMDMRLKGFPSVVRAYAVNVGGAA